MFNKVLVVAAHPDDEAIGAGGAIRRHVLAGDSVEVLYLTAGERGMPGYSVQETGSIRMLEGHLCSSILGSKVVDNWYLPDGSVQYEEVLRDRMTEVCHGYDLIYVTHEKEAHPDHRMAGKLVREALKQLDHPPECLTYEVWTPIQIVDRVLDITDVMDDKEAAIMAHDSQASRNHFEAGARGLARYRGVMNGRCEYAEVFSRMRLNGAEGMKIALALFTYSPSANHARSEYARITLKSVLKNIEKDPFDTIHLHIADDGSAPEHVAALIEIAKAAGYDPSVSNGERGGYGRSYNLMCQALHESFDMIMPIEDDWEMTRPLNISNLAKAIDESHGEIKCIRMGHLGFTQEIRGKLAYYADQKFLVLDPNSSDPHVFAGHPRLETVAFEREIGEWPTGVKAGYTEWEVAHRWQSRVGVAWPMDLCIPASQVSGAIFSHIGSVQTAEIEEGS